MFLVILTSTPASFFSTPTTEGGDSLKLADFGLAMSMSEKSEEENTDEVSVYCVIWCYIMLCYVIFGYVTKVKVPKDVHITFKFWLWHTTSVLLLFFILYF